MLLNRDQYILIKQGLKEYYSYCEQLGYTPQRSDIEWAVHYLLTQIGGGSVTMCESLVESEMLILEEENYWDMATKTAGNALVGAGVLTGAAVGVGLLIRYLFQRKAIKKSVELEMGPLMKKVEHEKSIFEIEKKIKDLAEGKDEDSSDIYTQKIDKLKETLQKLDNSIESIKGQRNRKATAERKKIHKEMEIIRSKIESVKSKRDNAGEDKNIGKKKDAYKAQLDKLKEMQSDYFNEIDTEYEIATDSTDAIAGKNPFLKKLASKERLAIRIEVNKEKLKYLKGENPTDEIKKLVKKQKQEEAQKQKELDELIEKEHTDAGGRKKVRSKIKKEMDPFMNDSSFKKLASDLKKLEEALPKLQRSVNRVRADQTENESELLANPNDSFFKKQRTEIASERQKLESDLTGLEAKIKTTKESLKKRAEELKK